MPDPDRRLTRQQRRELERKGALPKQESPLSPSPQLIAQKRSVSWSGPLPPPGILQQYNVIKDGPERVFRMAEQQAKHRRKIENRDSWTETFQRVFGSISGAAIGLVGLGGGIWLLDRGHGIGGFSALIMSVALLVSAVQGAKRETPPQSEEASASPEQPDLFEESGSE